MKRARIMGFLLAVGIVLSSFNCGALAVKATDFTDVPATAWYRNAVDNAAQKGLFHGTSKTTFSPNTPMTRGMFVTVLANLHGIDQSEYNYSVYNDMKSIDYFCAAASWASENGIVGGVGNGRFHPGGDVTREQIAVMLYKYFEKFGFDLVEKAGDITAFPDSASVSPYAQEAMEWATAYGVISGSSGKLDPKGSASRAQVAQLLMNFDNLEQYRAEGKPEIPDTPGTPSNPLAAYNQWFESRVWEAEMEAAGYGNWSEILDEAWTKTTSLSDFESQEAYDEAYNTAWIYFRDTIVRPWVDNYDRTVTYDIPTGCSEPDEQGGFYDYDLANEVMKQINILRAQDGKGALRYHPVVASWADIRSKEVAAVYGHTRPDGSGALTVGGGALNAENVSQKAYSKAMYGETNEELAITIAHSWYNSSGHRANMLNAREGSVAVVSCYVLPKLNEYGEEYSFVSNTHLFTTREPSSFDFPW